MMIGDITSFTCRPERV